MSLPPINYPGLPKRLTGGTDEPVPGQPAFDANFIDDSLVNDVVPAVNALVVAVRTVGSLRWEVVDARASLGKQGAVRGDPARTTTFGPPYRVEWLVDPTQAAPVNFFEAGRVEAGVTYPGDYVIEISPVSGAG